MRALWKVLAWLVGLGVLVAVALVVGCVWLYRRAVAQRADRERIEWERRQAEVRGLAYVDPAGRCGWCGGVHVEHPAVFHAVSVAERIGGGHPAAVAVQPGPAVVTEGRMLSPFLAGQLDAQRDRPQVPVHPSMTDAEQYVEGWRLAAPGRPFPRRR